MCFHTAMSFLIPKGKQQGFDYGGGNLATLFQEHVIAKKSLVSTLIQFYVDIEIMGREFDGARHPHSQKNKSLKVLYLVTLYSECTRAQTFQIFFLDGARMFYTKFRGREQLMC